MPHPTVPAAGGPPRHRRARFGDRVKRAVDLALGGALLVAALPVIGAAWAAVRLTSAGPGFYTQTRVGWHGRVYRIIKVRTMYHNCELTSGIVWSHKADPRVTAVGRVLRKLHVDELPQLWNVVRGEMSLVGPRPERPEIVETLRAEIPGYADRHRVRPGLTGLAQIQLPPDSSTESVRAKLVLDHCYVEARRLGLDLRILFGTAVYLLGFSYAAVQRVARLPDPLARKRAAGPHPPRVVGPTKVDAGAADRRAAAGVDDPVPCSEGT